jgi:hypothetical protein
MNACPLYSDKTHKDKLKGLRQRIPFDVAYPIGTEVDGSGLTSSKYNLSSLS